MKKRFVVSAVVIALLTSIGCINAAEPVQTEPTEQIESEPIFALESATVSETAGVGREIFWTSLGEFQLTAYCSCVHCCGYWATIRPVDELGNPIVYTASGEIAQQGVTIAVDPSIIPYGTEVKIGDHIYVAQDTGGAIDNNRIDVYFDNHQEALLFGMQTEEVFVKEVK